MREHAFSLNRIILCNNRITYPVLMQKNTGQRKPVFSHILRSDISYFPENNHEFYYFRKKKAVSQIFGKLLYTPLSSVVLQTFNPL